MKKITTTLLLILTVQLTYSQLQKIEQLKRDYVACSLQNINGNALPLIKWENTEVLKYHISGDFKFVSKKNWVLFLSDLEKLTGFKIIETSDFSEANIFIYFGELNAYFNTFNIKIPERLTSNFDNWDNRKYNSMYQLTQTSFCLVPSKIKDTQRGYFKLKQSFIKALGLLGQSKSEFSIFHKDQANGNAKFSLNDRRIIKIHYNSELKAGMPIDRVNEILNNDIELETIIKEKY